MWGGIGLAFQDGGSVFLFASWLGLIGVEARAGAGVLLSGMIIDGAVGYELCVDGGMNALRCCLLRTCSRPTAIILYSVLPEGQCFHNHSRPVPSCGCSTVGILD